jgi:hypothetical protein
MKNNINIKFILLVKKVVPGISSTWNGEGETEHFKESNYYQK